MTKIRLSLRNENQQLLKNNFVLPFFENGKVKFLKREADLVTKKLREPA